METNKTDKTVLAKGLKTLLFAVLCLFSGPILLSLAYSKPNSPFYYPLFIIACAVCILAIFLIFKGIKTIMDSMFNKK
ncbi:DUF6095 family protein [Tamlana sp. I1]|uniref:DUF6095 family protein n=1 Tax=Tamlana sp. I1 TaxID=2762061 RepID=UPI00188F62A5|nr:DUF6095 family protein [Tamlana sp. I1]